MERLGLCCYTHTKADLNFAKFKYNIMRGLIKGLGWLIWSQRMANTVWFFSTAIKDKDIMQKLNKLPKFWKKPLEDESLQFFAGRFQGFSVKKNDHSDTCATVNEILQNLKCRKIVEILVELFFFKLLSFLNNSSLCLRMM